MYNLESVAQPQAFNNAFSSFWWAVATITTVGYGDIYPITIAGKLISALISFLGIALVAIPTGIISAGFNELTEKDRAEEYRFCPFCGNKIK
jgi:voltage-gated potassium channel